MAGKDPHGPNRLSNYFNVHDKVMRDLVDRQFVLSDDLAVSPFGNGYLIMQGTVQCLGDIEVTVEKLLILADLKSGEPTVQTVEYRYNARIRGVGNIVRHDGPHSTHNQFHHVHRYDVFNGDEEGTVKECEWPTLGQMLYNLEEWYYANYDEFRRG